MVFGKVSARGGVEVEVSGLVAPGDRFGIFLVGDETNLDAADPFWRGGFAEGDAEHRCSDFCNFRKRGD